MPRRLQVVLESDGNVTKYKPMAVYTLVAFFRSKIGIKLMKLHVFLLGWSISIAGTVLLLFVLYLVRHVTVEGFTVERGGADRDGTALKHR